MAQHVCCSYKLTRQRGCRLKAYELHVRNDPVQLAMLADMHWNVFVCGASFSTFSVCVQFLHLVLPRSSFAT
jgi:hypothetical protein